MNKHDSSQCIGGSPRHFFAPGRRFMVSLALTSASALIPPAMAADVKWVGTVNNDWSEAGNWSPELPGNNDDVSIGLGANIGVGKTVTGGKVSMVSGSTLAVEGAGVNLTVKDISIGVDYTHSDVGQAALILSDGGQVTSEGKTQIGTIDHSHGSMTVSGTGSIYTAKEFMALGETGVGRLNVLKGGRIISPAHALFIGHKTDSRGWALVEGTGSALEFDKFIEIGHDGNGDLIVTNGGQVRSEKGKSKIASGPHARGYTTVKGAGSEFSTETIEIGLYGIGRLDVSNGGLVSNKLMTLLGSSGGSSGTMIVDGAGSRVFSGTKTIIARYGTGMVVLSNGATLSSGGVVNIGEDEGSFGTLAIGASAENLSKAPGRLIADDIAFGKGKGRIVFNHMAKNYVFSPVLSGAGRLEVLSGTTILTGNSPDFTGAVVLTGGSLAVNGVLSGAKIETRFGATLSGRGTVGNIVARPGAFVSPGNSVGTLSVAGDYHQIAGSTYRVEVRPDAADLIAVQGKASIDDGAVLMVEAAGSYDARRRYRVLTALQGVTGTYQLDGDTEISPFVELTAQYDANNVYLLPAQTRSFLDIVGLTPSQSAVAGALDSLPGDSALRLATAWVMSEDEARSAFDVLADDLYPSIESAMIEDSRFARDAVVNRLRATIACAGGQAAGLAECGRSVWAQGYGDWTSAGSGGGFTHTSGGFFSGIDGLVADNWRIGLFGGYGHSRNSASGRAALGMVDNASLGLYGGAQWDQLGLKLGGAYMWSDVDTRRDLSFSDFSDSLSGHYRAGTGQIFGDLGYRIDCGRISFEPFTGLAYVNVHSDSFIEEGGPAALTGQGSNNSTAFSTIGLRNAADFSLGSAHIAASATLAWRHAFSGTATSSAFSFAGSDPFAITGRPVVRDALLVDIGLSAKPTERVTASLSYTGQFGKDTSRQGVRGMVSVSF